MKWLTAVAKLLAVSLAALGLLSGPDAASANEGVEGNWQGQLIVTPQITLRITLEITNGTNGSFSGKWGSPDEALSALPLESIVLQGGVLTFRAKPTGATFKGKLNESEKEVVGDWTQNGKNFAISFKRFDPSTVAVAPIPQEL